MKIEDLIKAETVVLNGSEFEFEQIKEGLLYLTVTKGDGFLCAVGDYLVVKEINKKGIAVQRMVAGVVLSGYVKWTEIEIK